MPMKKKGKGGKKLVRAKSLNKVKPLSVDTYVTINGVPGDSSAPPPPVHDVVIPPPLKSPVT
jgi:hypothetical protein